MNKNNNQTSLLETCKTLINIHSNVSFKKYIKSIINVLCKLNKDQINGLINTHNELINYIRYLLDEIIMYCNRTDHSITNNLDTNIKDMIIHNVLNKDESLISYIKCLYDETNKNFLRWINYYQNYQNNNKFDYLSLFYDLLQIPQLELYISNLINKLIFNNKKNIKHN